MLGRPTVYSRKNWNQMLRRQCWMASWRPKPPTATCSAQAEMMHRTLAPQVRQTPQMPSRQRYRMRQPRLRVPTASA